MKPDLDLNPLAAAQVLADLGKLERRAQLGEYDLETVASSYLAEAKARAAVERWEMACPAEMKLTDWKHTELQPYAAQISKVLNHEVSKKGLILTGRTGRGKTRVMWQLMRRLACEEGRDVRYWTANEWFSRLQEQVHYGRDEAIGWVKTAARRPIVFIDDLGKEAVLESKRAWAQSCFFEFLDTRVGLGLPLYITTNLTAKEIASVGGSGSSMIGDPLLRRLLGVCEVIKF